MTTTTDTTPEYCLICGNRGATVCGCCGLEHPVAAEELITDLERQRSREVTPATVPPDADLPF